MGRDHAREQALEAMLLALQQAAVDATRGALFLRARAHAGLRALFDGGLVCHQDFKPQALLLESGGFKCVEKPEGKYPLVLLLPDRQKEETLADFALAFDLLEDGGVLLVSLHNDWGARRYEKILADFAGNIGSFSKHHCRAFWAQKTHAPDAATHAEWRAHGELRRVIDGRFWSLPGLFNWDRIDDGSQLLVQHLPPCISGRVCDLGAGWGFLSDHILRSYPDILSLDCFEGDRVALECLRRNLGLVPTMLKPKLHWADVTQGVGVERADFVVMNPPFHDGRAADPLIGAKFIAAAAQMLKPGGELWMVANRNLPYEHFLEEAFVQNRLVVQENGFKVLAAVKGEREKH